MPRKRKSKKTVQEKPKVEPLIATINPESNTGEKQLKTLKAISYEAYTKFIRSDENIIVVSYEVPTMRLTGEDQIRNWKLGLETALVNAANYRKLIISRDKFRFEALPQGETTLLKAFFRMADVTGGAGKEQHFKQKPPLGKEGIIIEE